MSEEGARFNRLIGSPASLGCNVSLRVGLHKETAHAGAAACWGQTVAGHIAPAHAPAMFAITEAAAIRAVYQQRGELSAAIELRRLFPGITRQRGGAGVCADHRRLGSHE
jgi:hypothetical protein